MNKKQINSDSVSDELPPQHTKYPWLVAQPTNYKGGVEAEEQIFYNIHNPSSPHRCRIPELIGKHIQACFHGWVVLSNLKFYNIMWSLWNPQTSKIIQLPPLVVRTGGQIHEFECCLSSPPNDPNSIFFLTTSKEPKFIFCILGHKSKKKLNWTEMSYDKQLWNITGSYHGLLVSPTYVDGKIYVLSSRVRGCCENFVIHVEIGMRDKIVCINLIPLVKLPPRPEPEIPYSKSSCFLKGSCDHLFFIYLIKKRWEIVSVYLYKLDMASKLWEKMEDLKDAMFIVDLFDNNYVNCSPAIPCELKGYIHILDQMNKIINSYNVRSRTTTIFHMPQTGLSPTNYALWSMPECRLQGDYGEMKCSVKSKQEEDNEYDMVVNDELLFRFPFHILELILKFCDDVDYLNFLATCKQFAMLLPVIRWSNITEIPRLQTYSLVSPWSMVLDTDRGIITNTDPMLGNKYFLQRSQELVGDLQIHCSKNGWLLMSKNTLELMFFNPFTSDIRKLPHLDNHVIDKCCFSAAPTSSDCMVVVIKTIGRLNIYIHLVSREQSWRRLSSNDFYSSLLCFPTFYGLDIYTLIRGRLFVFRHTEEDDYLWRSVERDVPYKYIEHLTNYYLTKSDQHLLLVFVDVFEKSVEVHKLNQSTSKLEKLKSLGKDVIYVSETTCLCIEATTPKMENKIYFHQSYSENNTILFYSLETGRFHAFDDDNMKGSCGDLFMHKRLLRPHGWIEPSCS